MVAEDERIGRAKAMPMDTLISNLDLRGLVRMGVERTGPCPQCGGDDRFSINVRKGMFLCRRCGANGDQIALVRFVKGCEFLAALDWMFGPSQELTPAEREARDKRDAENQRRKEAEAAKFRQKAIAAAREIWMAGLPAEQSPVRDYLALRGISAELLPQLPIALRFHPALPYMVQEAGGRWIEVYRGPAMLAAVQGADARFCAVHRTWFDLGQPQGKAQIPHPVTGEALGRKKTWGSKKGGVIRLSPGQSATLVMGEGIETTLTARIAGVYPDAMFWAGVDLGNMAGRRETGRGLKFAGLPDLADDEAFVPPPYVTRMIYVQDGDSDPRDTRSKLEAGLRRAMVLRPGLRGQIAPAPKGFDLNDVLLSQAQPGGAA